MKCDSYNKRDTCNRVSLVLGLTENMSKDEKYQVIIANYKIKKDENNVCPNSINNLEDAIIFAAQATDSTGKRFLHQRRIRKKCLMHFRDNILRYRENINNANSFEDLHAIVEKARIYGIGELAVYDTAQRIGQYMGLYPNYVYMHAGTRSGARNLIGEKARMNMVDKTEFPESFRKLSCAEIEDILCIYKDYL